MSLHIFFISEEGIENKTLELGDKENSVLDSKLDLLRFIFAGTGVSDLELFEVKRLSKRHKNYVSLNTKNDFREFRRSLKVKRRAKILVFTDKGHRDPVDGFKLLNVLLESLGKCFEKSMCPGGIKLQINQQNDELSSSSPVEHTHDHILCDACNSLSPESISGVRYKCIVCHDYDLCSSCFTSGQVSGSHEKSHPMIAIDSPNDMDKWSLGFIFKSANILNDNKVNLQNLQHKIDKESLLRSEENITHIHEHQVEKEFHNQTMTKETKTETSAPTHVEDAPNSTALQLSFKPIGESLAHVVIKNMGEHNFDINGFTFDVKYADHAKSSTLIERNHVIKPRRCIRLNVRINSSHFEYPIQISLHKGFVSGNKQLSSKSECENLILKKVDNDTSFADVPQTCAQTTPSCSELSQVTESVHTLILPNPMKDHSFNTLESWDAASESKSEDDYDLVSMTDADELLSDFEIVSRVNSIQM